MADVTDWSPVDDNNSVAPPDGFPEGMPASTINDSSRAVMGAVRRLADDGGFFDHGHTYTYVSSTQFDVTGQHASIYQVGRAVRIVQTGGTVYGTIADVTETANTLVTITQASGPILNEAMDVSVGTDARAAAVVEPVLGTVAMVFNDPARPADPGWIKLTNASQSLSKTTYSRLYQARGAPHGEDASTFNVPPIAGRMAIGSGSQSGLTTRTVGQTGGEESVTLVDNQMPSHDHNIFRDEGRENVSGSPGPNDTIVFRHDVTTGGAFFENRGYNVKAATQGGWAGKTNTKGNDQPHENMPPFVVIEFWMYTGYFG